MGKITTTLFGDLGMLPFQARNPLNERLEWLTDVIEAYDGSEERIELRTMPRTIYEMQIPVSFLKKHRAFNTVYGNIRGNWAIPFWPEMEYVGTITQDQITITCDTLVHDLREDSLALLYVSDTDWQIIEIETTTDTSISIYGTGADAMTGAWLIPVRVGFIKGDVDLPTTGRSGVVKGIFILDDPMPLTPSVPTQYLGDDVVLVESEGDSSGQTERSIIKQQDFADFDLGPIERFTNWDYTRYSEQFHVIYDDLDDIRTFREFLYRRAGKYRRFWLPTMEADLRLLSSGTLTTTFNVESASMIDYVSDRTHIVIRTLDGSWYCREITDLTQIDSDTVQVTIDSSIATDAEDIVTISYLGLYRLDTDRIEMNWIGDKVMKASFSIVEIEP